LDAFGSLDILNTLSFKKQINLSLIASTLDPVSTYVDAPEVNVARSKFSQSIVPTHTFSHPPEKLDVLLVPGGFGAHLPPPARNDAVEYIKLVYPSLQYIFSVCTGAMLLARAGVLKGKRATANKAYFHEVVATDPEAHWVPVARWVTDGKVWTTSGVSAGMDGMLGLLEHIYDRETSVELAKILEYEWHSDSSWDPFALTHNIPKVTPPS
jgi:transcriptional regulator GlxA family with amidase domain